MICLQDKKCQSYNCKSDVSDAKKKIKSRKTWGVTHVLIIMEEVLLSKVLSLQRSLLCFLIETVTKFSNVIGYH